MHKDIAQALGVGKRLYYRAVPPDVRAELCRRFVESLAPLKHAGKLGHTLRQLPAAIDTRWTQDRIASHSGFGSVDALQRAFARQHGLTPQAYRDGERRA